MNCQPQRLLTRGAANQPRIGHSLPKELGKVQDKMPGAAGGQASKLPSLPQPVGLVGQRQIVEAVGGNGDCSTNIESAEVLLRLRPQFDLGMMLEASRRHVVEIAGGGERSVVDSGDVAGNVI